MSRGWGGRLHTAEFESTLRELIGHPTEQRPFICDGNPLECTVFLVGTNPATEVSKSFWDFWNPDSGFDKHAWFETYKHERKAKPLKPGRTRRNEVSTTRKYLEQVVIGCKPVKCLETNVYSYPSSELSELSVLKRRTKVFDWLLEAIRPKALLLFGDEAVKHISQLTHSPLVINNVSKLKINDLQVFVLPKSHLASRKGDWSNEKAHEVGQQLKQLISS